jgi:hypothetical protein
MLPELIQQIGLDVASHFEIIAWAVELLSFIY